MNFEALAKAMLCSASSLKFLNKRITAKLKTVIAKASGFYGGSFNIETIFEEAADLMERNKRLSNFYVYLITALKGLKIKETKVLIMRFFKNISIETISEILKMSERSVYNLITKGTVNLGEVLCKMKVNEKEIKELLKSETLIGENYYAFDKNPQRSVLLDIYNFKNKDLTDCYDEEQLAN